MIKKIDYIRSFGIYKNFDWAAVGLKDFSNKNIFYGWNYSGKTTLSRLFSSLKDKKVHDDFVENSSFKLTSERESYQNDTIHTYPRNVEVFNSDYIRENLKWEFDDDINAISFEVGESIEIREKITTNEAEIVDINGSEHIIGKKTEFEESIEEYDNFENLYSIEAKRIKNDAFSSLIEFNKGHLKKVKDFIIEDINSFIISDNEELKQLQSIVKIESPKDELAYVTYDSILSDIYTASVNILINTPSKNTLIDILDKSHANYSWAKRGLDIHVKGDDCIFCGNELSDQRFDELTNYFNNQASVVREEVQRIRETINHEIAKLNIINFPLSANDFNNGFQSKYEALLSKGKKAVYEAKKMLKTLLEDLQQKEEENIYALLNTLAVNESTDLQSAIYEINNLITENNDFTINFSSIINKERSKYQNHLVATFLKEEKYHTVKSKKEKAQKEIEKLNTRILELEKENIKLRAQIDSISAGCDELNTFIQSFLNRTDIEIEINKSTNKFNLKREGKLAKNLSEGEKTAIAFSHFLVLICSLEAKDELKETIIYIDDPISSLDSNHVFQINSLLKDIFCHFVPNIENSGQFEWALKCKQLFISTHNYEFFILLKELPPTNKNKESKYFILRKDGESSISPLPYAFDKYSSEYQYLFGEMYEFIKEPNHANSYRLLLMPNIFRRFLELYTLSKYPSYEEVDKRADKIFGGLASKRILKVLHYFSHLNSIERISRHSDFISDIEVATTELINHIKTNDPIHYEALEASIKLT